MQFNQFVEATTLTDNDILLIQETGTLAVKKVKLSTVKQYIGVSSGGNSTGSIKDEILKDKPLGYWHLDETTGSIASNSGSAMSNGTYSNVLLAQPSLATGSNYSASFNGSNSSVSFVNTLINSNTDISLECVIKLPSISLKGSFIKIGNNGVGIGIGIGGSTHDDLGNNLIALAEGVAWKPTTVKLDVGVHHVGLAFKGSTNKEWLFYLDGFMVATLSSQFIYTPNNQGFIGTGDNNRYVRSTIDEVAIYDKILPPIRWLAHANTVVY